MAGSTRTRFAPSPTGYLHTGNARTALFNWLYARRCNGSFILRIEDTDTARSRPEFEAAVMEDLRWLGLDWDEGPDVGGAAGPYRQSERLRFYASYADWLVRHELAYPCWCSKERLEELKQGQIKAGIPPRYDNKCRAAGATGGVNSPVIRFKTPPRPAVFNDGVHGRLSFDAGAFGDFVIIGSDKVASYNFAVVIDDALMEVTHVIRGDDHLSNTPRQILLFQALGFPTPVFSHIPLVLGPDRSPLSKRDSAASIRTLREAGYLPAAVLNTMSRLGWSPVDNGGDRLLTLGDMTEVFDMKRLSKSPSVFDTERLGAFNKAAIGDTDGPELARLVNCAPDAVDVIEAVKANAATLVDIKGLIEPFIGDPTFTEEAHSVLRALGAQAVLKAFVDEASKTAVLDAAAYDGIMKTVRTTTGEKGKGLFLPIRCALTGRTDGIELVKIFKILGRDKAVERLRRFVV